MCVAPALAPLNANANKHHHNRYAAAVAATEPLREDRDRVLRGAFVWLFVHDMEGCGWVGVCASVCF